MLREDEIPKIFKEFKLEQIKNNFSAFAQKIFQSVYLKPFTGKPKEKLNQLPVERISHGVQHVSRVAGLVRVVVNFYRACGNQEALNLTKEEILILQIVALCHDAKRKDDYKDVWEAESEQYCKETLLNLGLSEGDAKKYASIITLKEKQGLLGRIFQTADALDIMRVKRELAVSRLSIYQDIKDNPAACKELGTLIHEVLQLIASQHDLKFPCQIDLSNTENVLVPTMPVLATRDKNRPELKSRYEHHPDAYQHTVDDFRKFPLLNKLYANNTSETHNNESIATTLKVEEHSTDRVESKISREFYQKLFKEDAVVYSSDNGYFLAFKTQEKAENYHNILSKLLDNKLKSSIQFNGNNTSPYEFSLTQPQFTQLMDNYQKFEQKQEESKPPFLIKAVRADSNCFVDMTITSITRSKEQQKKLHFRPFPKRLWTVFGDKFVKRSDKQPRWKQEEKLGFSQPQSASLVTTGHWSGVFGFNRDRKEKLVGFLFDQKDALLNRMFIYDGGTVARPYDQPNMTLARQYFNEKTEKNKILFANETEFKKAIADPKNKDNFNEVLARLAWNKDGSSKVFVATDNLESRLLAQEYAHRLKLRLREQARENGEVWDESYEPPICFYMPGKPLHLKSYDAIAQLKDKIEAKTLCRRKNFTFSENYELLLALDDPKEALLTPQKAKNGLYLPVAAKILLEGQVHLVRFLLDRMEDANAFLTNLKYCLPEGLAYETMLNHAARVGDEQLVAWLCSITPPTIDTALNAINNYHSGIARKVIELIPKLTLTELNKLLLSAAQHGDAETIRLLLGKGADVNHENLSFQTRTTPLVEAAEYGDIESVRALIEADDLMINHPRVSFAFGKRSALMIAAEKGNYEIVKLLLENNSSVDTMDSVGATAFFLAVREGNADIAKLLFAKSKEYINTPNVHKRTPLMNAVIKGDTELVEFLISKGADVNYSTDGIDILSNAAVNHHHEIIAILVKNGAKVTRDMFLSHFYFPSSPPKSQKFLNTQYLLLMDLVVQGRLQPTNPPSWFSTIFGREDFAPGYFKDILKKDAKGFEDFLLGFLKNPQNYPKNKFKEILQFQPIVDLVNKCNNPMLTLLFVQHSAGYNLPKLAVDVDKLNQAIADLPQGNDKEWLQDRMDRWFNQPETEIPTNTFSQL